MKMSERKDDCVDTKPIQKSYDRFSQPKQPWDDEDLLTQIDEDDEDYNTNHDRRGKAVIFVHDEFDIAKVESKKTSTVDEENLEETLTALGFDVEVHKNLLLSDLAFILNKLTVDDYSQCDCLLIAVITSFNAKESTLYAKDKDYSPDILWKKFSGDQVPSLAGKPKIFLIEADRGIQVDEGVKIKLPKTRANPLVESDASPEEKPSKVYKIPAMADCLIVHSSAKGYRSISNVSGESLFVQKLCEVLRKHSKTKDLLTMLTLVNKAMALENSSDYQDGHVLEGVKQIGTITSSFTRRLYFKDKK